MTDANAAIANCTEVQYDFILSDFNLGEGQDGYQLFEALETSTTTEKQLLFFADQRRMSSPDCAWRDRIAAG